MLAVHFWELRVTTQELGDPIGELRISNQERRVIKQGFAVSKSDPLVPAF